MEVRFNPEPFSTKITFCSFFQDPNSFWGDLKRSSSSVFLLAEEITSRLFGKKITKRLEEEGIFVITLTVPGGEKMKSLSYQEKITDFMLQRGIGRDSCLIALGGGALLDVGGFVASIYLRGIPFIAVPTTLLAMVDACLGGKTALNTPFGKNSLGTFYPASEILIALECLFFLPKEEKQNALAEIIKYALILDKELFTLLQEGKELFEKEDPPFMEKLLYLSLKAKKSVIEKDLKELGPRRILNFGHTIAHALEGFWHYQMPHGTAVAIGLLIESRLSFNLGLLSYEELESILFLLKRYDLIKSHPPFSYSDLEPFLLKDKKNKDHKIRFVLLSSIGKINPYRGEYCTVVPEKALLESLSWYHSLSENPFLIKS